MREDDDRQTTLRGHVRLVITFATIAVVLAFAFVARLYDCEFYARAGAVALLVHVWLAVAVLPRLSFDWDKYWFHETALAYLGGGLPNEPFTVEAFSAFQSVLYAAFGADMTVLAVTNGLMAVLVAIPVRELSRMLYPDGPTGGRGVVATVLFLPIPFVFLTVPMRDSMAVLLAFLVLVLLLRAVDRVDGRPVILAVPAVAALAHLRTEIAILCVFGGMAAVVIRGIKWLTDEDLSLSEMIGLAGGVGLVGFSLFVRRNSFEGLSRRMQDRQVGEAVYLPAMQYNSWGDVLLAAPARAVYFQYAPFPLHVNSAADLFAVASLPALVVLTVAAYRSLRQCAVDTAYAVGLLVVYLGGVVGYGLVDSNFGTTIRHRVPFVFLLVVFAAPVLDRWADSVLARFREGPNQYSENDEQDEETREL